MTWPPNATRAEILRILEINKNIYTEWVITRAETEAILELLAARDVVLAAARNLLAKIDALMPAINGAFQIQAIHGFKYNGPNMADELRDLRAALATLAPGQKEGRDG